MKNNNFVDKDEFNNLFWTYQTTRSQELYERLQLDLYTIAGMIVAGQNGITGQDYTETQNEIWLRGINCLDYQKNVRNPWAFVCRALTLKFYSVLDKEITYRKRQARLRKGQV